jgi:hypothetical protein
MLSKRLNSVLELEIVMVYAALSHASLVLIPVLGVLTIVKLCTVSRLSEIPFCEILC